MRPETARQVESLLTLLDEEHTRESCELYLVDLYGAPRSFPYLKSKADQEWPIITLREAGISMPCLYRKARTAHEVDVHIMASSARTFGELRNNLAKIELTLALGLPPDDGHILVTRALISAAMSPVSEVAGRT